MNALDPIKKRWQDWEGVEALDEKEDGLQVEHRTWMGHTCLLLDLYNGSG